MVKIIDTSIDFLSIYNDSQFDLEKWKSYVDKWIPGTKQLCLNDMKECINAGYSWEKDYLPVLNGVLNNHKREKAINSFYQVSEHIDERIIKAFGKSLDVDIILYIGLCNGAGWVTTINDKVVVLLGIEKIIELDWCNKDDMTGLIIHELGHVYQAQYGSLYIDTKSKKEKFLWQLFTEGIAMVFEQEVVGDPNYFHQDKNGWKAWCDQNIELIKHSFNKDLDIMEESNQRYFGDWVNFEGHSDVGYYLGARFVRFLLQNDNFENIINYDINKVQAEYIKFIN